MLRLDRAPDDGRIAEQVLEPGLEPADREQVLRRAWIAGGVGRETRQLARAEVGQPAGLGEAVARRASPARTTPVSADSITRPMAMRRYQE